MTDPSKPLDLTTIGAAVQLPPRDHPIFQQGEIPVGIEMSPQQMALKILALEFRLVEVERIIHGK